MPIIIWTNGAKIDYWENIDFLVEKWTLKETENFILEVDTIINQLIERNIEFKATEFENIFYVPITKQITLYYKVFENEIQLLRFWNTYQNPSSLKLL